MLTKEEVLHELEGAVKRLAKAESLCSGTEAYSSPEDRHGSNSNFGNSAGRTSLESLGSMHPFKSSVQACGVER